jgi:hypothetical protein
MRWTGHVACMGKTRNAYRILVRKQEGKRPLGRRRLTWVEIIKMDDREIQWGSIYWIVHSGSRKCWKILE